MIKPTIHLNGSSADQLFEQLSDAIGAAYRLLDALSLAAPNGRDYYPQGPDALKLATVAHVSRVARIQSVLDELRELSEHVADEQDRRNEQRNNR
jgi:hypothetical protein